MKYLVMETHPGYAIVLDSQGRFIKVANMNYEIGQTVSSVIKIKAPLKSKKRYPVRILTTAAAACFGIIVIGLYQGVYRPAYVPYGTVEMQINPGIQLTLSENYNVLALQPLNEDGRILLADYDDQGKKAQTVLYDLVYRSLELGYLKADGEVILTASSEDDQWQEDTQETFIHAVEFYTQMFHMSVTVTDSPLDESYPPLPQIVIPFGDDEAETSADSDENQNNGQSQETVQVQESETVPEAINQESSQPSSQGGQTYRETQPPEVQPETVPGNNSNYNSDDNGDDDDNSDDDNSDDDNSDDDNNDDDNSDDDNSDDDYNDDDVSDDNGGDDD